MFPYLLILFTVVPALELVLLIEVGRHIGSINTLLVIVLTGILGASLARYQGFLVLNKIQTNLGKGHLPSEELMDGLMILVGGIVLLTPGFATDALGFMLLIPLTRTAIKKLVRKRMEDMIRKGQIVQVNQFQTRDDGYTDIDI